MSLRLHVRRRRALGLTLGAVLLFGAANAPHAAAQEKDPPTEGPPAEGPPRGMPPRGLGASIEGGWSGQTAADVRGSSGSLRLSEAGGQAGYAFPLRAPFFAVITAGRAEAEYDLQDATLDKEGLIPLHVDRVYADTLGVLISYKPDDSPWSLLGRVGASRQYEDGADPDDGLSGSLIAFATRKFSDRLSLGVGVLGGTRIEDDPRVIVVPTLELGLTKRLTLKTERGLVLAYRPEDRRMGVWTASALFNDRRIRLADDRPAASEGMLEHRFVEARLAWSKRLWGPIFVELFAGSVVWQELRIEDRDGRKLREFRTDPAWRAGGKVQMRF